VPNHNPTSRTPPDHPPTKRKRGNGEGSVYREAARERWVGQVMIDGRRYRVTAPTKTDARRRLDDLKAKVRSGVPIGDRNTTVRSYLQWWLNEVLPGTVSAGTEEHYESIVARYIEPYVGSRRLAALTSAHVTRMLRELERQGYSANTRRLARSVLRRALQGAVAESMLARNVAALAPGPRIGKSRTRTLSPEEAQQFLAAAATDRLEAAWVLMAALGLRRGETLGLAWEDIDLNRGTVTIQRSLTRSRGRLVLGETKTPGSRRSLHLPESLVETLRRQRVRQAEERLRAGECWADSGLVVTTEIGTAFDPDNLRHRLSALTRRAGLGHWTPHQLRHTAASVLFAMSVPIEVISEVLGHSSIRITKDTYGHLREPAFRAAAMAMEQALWG